MCMVYAVLPLGGQGAGARRPDPRRACAFHAREISVDSAMFCRHAAGGPRVRTTVDSTTVKMQRASQPATCLQCSVVARLAEPRVFSVLIYALTRGGSTIVHAAVL